MIDLKNAAAALILGFAVAGALASPTLALTAQERAARTTIHPGHAARAQAIPGEAGAIGMTQHRVDAMRECNERANRYVQYTYGNMQTYAYRSCMMEHGEPD